MWYLSFSVRLTSLGMIISRSIPAAANNVISIFFFLLLLVSLQSCPTLCNPIDGSHQVPLSTGFSRQEYWSRLPFPSPNFFFSGWVIFHCAYVPHLYEFLLYWHLSYCHVLVIVNTTTMNIGVHMSLRIMVFCGYTSRSGIAGLYGSSTVSLRNLHTILHSDYTSFTFPPTVNEGSLFSLPSPAFIICVLFGNDHSDLCEVISHCSFDLHFSND